MTLALSQLSLRATPAASAAPTARAPRAVSLRTRLTHAHASPRVAPRSSPAVRAAAATGTIDFDAVGVEMDKKSPLEIMDYALATFGDEIGIAFSGAEDVALIEYAHLTGRKYRVFSLDTGRLNPETYQLFDAVEKHYKIKIEYTFPDAQECMDLVREKGMFSFYEDGHQECCRVRKVRPLRRQLKTLQAWITGQRKDQSPGTRDLVPVCQVDPVFEGVAGGPGSLIKFNPLSNATSQEVWNFLRVMGVPTNKLHACGYDSIGCEPCTRPVLPNQHEREGRWWWEDAKAKECGLHSGNKGYDEKAGEGAGGAKTEANVPDLFVAGGHVTNLDKAGVEALLGRGGKREKDTVLVVYAPWCQFCQGMEEAYDALAAEMKGGSVTVAKYRGDEDKAYVQANLQTETFPTIVMLPKNSDKVIKFPSERRDTETLGLWVKSLSGL